MKLTDVKLRTIGDSVYLVRLNAKGKVTQKIDCTEDISEIVIHQYDNVWLNHKGKSYLCAVREATKEQIATRNLEKKAEREISKRRGEKAFIKLQKMMSALYSGYDRDRLETLYKIIGRNR